MIKLKDKLNEASVPRNQLNRLGSELNKASDIIIKITDKYKKEGDIEGMVKAWMRGLHLRLKKSGIKMESINEGFTKYHIRLTKTPGWYGVWDKNGKQKFEGDKKYIMKHLKKLKTRMGSFQLKSLVDLATDRKGKDISFDVVESINEAKFSNDQIEIMRKAYGTLSRMDPSSPTYKKFTKFLDKLPKDQLKQLAAANIKWVSMLAKNRLRRIHGESVKEMLEATYGQMLAKKGKKINVSFVNGKPVIKVVPINPEPIDEAKRHPKFGKLVATITRGNDQIWELYSDVRWGGYVTPIIVYRDGRNDKGKEIDQFGPNMYTKPAIKKFEKKYGGGYAKAKIA